VSLFFAPFRAIGLITDAVPMSVKKAGSEHFVTTALDTSFHIYDAAKLRLKLVGEPTRNGHRIRCLLAANRQLTFVAAASTLYVYERAVIVRTHHQRQKLFFFFFFSLCGDSSSS
jgi:U3 small nucleolar RNA-associated protein 21